MMGSVKNPDTDRRLKHPDQQKRAYRHKRRKIVADADQTRLFNKLLRW